MTEKSYSFDFNINQNPSKEIKKYKLEKEEFLKTVFKKTKSQLFDWCVSYFLKPSIYIKDEEGINQFSKLKINHNINKNKYFNMHNQNLQFQSNNLTNFGSYNSLNYQGRMLNPLSLELNFTQSTEKELNSRKRASINNNYYKKKWRKRLIDKTIRDSKVLFSNNNSNSSSSGININNSGSNSNSTNTNTNTNNNNIHKKKFSNDLSNNINTHKSNKTLNNDNNENNHNHKHNNLLNTLKMEEQISILDSSLTKPLTNILFHPFESYYIATDGNQKIYIINWSKQPSEIINVFENGNPKNQNISSLSLMNDENDALLMTGSNDGAIRIWKNLTGKKKENDQFSLRSTLFSTVINNNNTAFSKFNSLYKSKMGFNNLTVPYSNEEEPELVTNWLALSELELNQRQKKSKYGLVVEWNQDKGEIIASGDSSRVIKIWDAESERIKLQFSNRCHHPITSIKSSQNSMLYAGASDGSVLLYDVREKNNSGLIMKFLVHNSPIINVCTQKVNKDQLLSGSEDGGIRLWDIRNHSPIWSLSTTTKETLTSLDIHGVGPYIATGSKSHFVNVYSLDGKLISNGKKWKGLISTKMGKVHSVKFHPYRPLLCVGTDLNTCVFAPIDVFKKK